MANTTNIDLVKPAGTDHALISVINSNSDKIDAEAGRQRGNFAGTYSSTSGYAVGDYCIYQGNLYRCTTAIGSSGENWTAGHWTSVKVGTELKGLSDQIANKSITGVTQSAHVSSSIVYRTGNVIYISITASGYSNGEALLEGLPMPANGMPVSAVGLSYDTGLPLNVSVMVGASRTDLKVFTSGTSGTFTTSIAYVTNAN